MHSWMHSWMHKRLPEIYYAKGQLISKTNCRAKDSSKKRTNEFVFTSIRRVFVRFLEESSARKKTFRDYLTFKRYENDFDQWPKLNLWFDVKPKIRILKVI